MLLLALQKKVLVLFLLLLLLLLLLLQLLLFLFLREFFSSFHSTSITSLWFVFCFLFFLQTVLPCVAGRDFTASLTRVAD